MFNVSEVSEAVTDSDDAVPGQLTDIEIHLRNLWVTLISQETNVESENHRSGQARTFKKCPKSCPAQRSVRSEQFQEEFPS